MNKNKNYFIAIVVLSVLLGISVLLNIYFSFFANKVVTLSKNNQFNAIGEFVYEEDGWIEKLFLKSDNTATYIAGDLAKDDYYEKQLKYFIGKVLDNKGKEKNIIITYSDEMFETVYYIIDSDTICNGDINCNEDYSSKFVRKSSANSNNNTRKQKETPKEESKNKEEITKEDLKNKEEIKKVSNVVSSASSKKFEEAIEDEIKYFDDLSNFDSKEIFNEYQEYVNLLKKANLTNYSENNDKVNVYIFIGQSCWHCLDEISWLSSKISEFSQTANIIVYEVWNNENNSLLMSEVGKTLNKTVSGVPFTVVGDKTFAGFSEEIGTKILNEIKNQYNSNNRYDVIKQLS